MELDLQYLLMLQELRNATGGIFDELFNAITKIAVDVMVFLPYLILWACDKEWGYRFVAVGQASDHASVCYDDLAHGDPEMHKE